MSVSLIRLLIGDRKKAAVNEVVGQGDSSNLNYQLDMFPLASSPTATLSITVSGAIVASSNYNVSGDVGRVTFLSAPTAGAQILGVYEYFALTSGEISDILSGHSGKPYLAASNAALVLAADNSRLFAYTMGDKSVDKRRISNDLRAQAAALENKHYTLKDKEGYTSEIFTFRDNSGTPYKDYDEAESYLNTED